ncbi:MAG TPA: transposase [Xanthobacteraceae bacterium]
MSDDRINPTRELANQPDAAADTLAGVRTEATAGGPRRRWSSADKARIVRESQEPGAVACKVAERYGLTRFQLYDWRRKARIAADKSAAVPNLSARKRRNGPESAALTVSPAFAPVMLTTKPTQLQPPDSEAGLVEIAIRDVSVRVRGVVDVEGLVAVLSAVRRTS